MKIKHKVPAHLVMRSDPVTPEYQAEIDRTMAKAETAYRQAQKRLQAAEKRLARARQQVLVRSTSKVKHALAELEALVELRRIELEQVHRLMVSTGAPSTSRGRKSHRHVAAAEVTP